MIEEKAEMIRNVAAPDAARMSVGEVADALRTDLDTGLTTVEAQRRQKFFGFNEFEVGEPEPLWKKYVEQVRFYYFLG